MVVREMAERTIGEMSRELPKGRVHDFLSGYLLTFGTPPLREKFSCGGGQIEPYH